MEGRTGGERVQGRRGQNIVGLLVLLLLLLLGEEKSTHANEKRITEMPPLRSLFPGRYSCRTTTEGGKKKLHKTMPEGPPPPSKKGP